MATKQPFGQARNQQSRDWGNFSALTDCPNASGWAGAPTNGLEEGDTAYVKGFGRVYCSSAGTPGSLTAVWAQTGGGTTSDLIYELDPTDVTEFGTPAWIRSTANTPATPGGSVTVSVSASASQPSSRSGLRIAGSINGGWVCPLANLNPADLPAEGYVVEAEIDEIGTWMFMLVVGGEFVNLGGASNTMRGFFLTQRLSAGNYQLYTALPNGGAAYTQPVALGSAGTSLTAPTAALFQRGPFRYRVEWRRINGSTPYDYQTRYYAEASVASIGYDVANVVSAVVSPAPAGMNGLTLPQVGVGVFSDSGGALVSEAVRVLSLKIKRLPT